MKRYDMSSDRVSHRLTYKESPDVKRAFDGRGGLQLPQASQPDPGSQHHEHEKRPLFARNLVPMTKRQSAALAVTPEIGHNP